MLSLRDVALILEGNVSNGSNRRLKLFISGDEVGFGIDLDQRSCLAVSCNSHETFRRDATGLLGRLGDALGA